MIAGRIKGATLERAVEAVRVLEWIKTRRQWRCDRCRKWTWTKEGDWLDRYSRCYCGREESVLASGT